MANSTWQPGWWNNDKHEGAWTRVKEAFHRDWEQTKADFSGKGADLDQDIDDTVKQAAGKDVIPPEGVPNAPGGTSKTRTWADSENALRYGVGAREQYGTEHPQWNDHLETRLKGDWEDVSNKAAQKWDDVKHDVRRAYERIKHLRSPSAHEQVA